MMGVGEALQLGILAVDRAGVLGQVVGAQGEEVDFFCQLVSDKDGSGGLDHDTDLEIAYLVAFLDQFLFALLHDGLGFDKFPFADDHGEHDAHVAVCGSAQQSAELFLEELGSGQADTQSTEAQCRVLFLVQIHVIDSLVRADIAGTDDDELGSQSLNNALVGCELLLFCGLFLAVEIYELGAEEADTFCIVLVYAAQVGGSADVGIYVHAAAVDCGAGLALEFLKQCILLEVFIVFCLQGRHQIGSGINVDTAVVAVQDGHLAVPAVVDILDLDQGRKVHGAGQDRGVAVGGALAGDHAQKEGLVELDSLRGSQILSDQD